MNPDFLPTANKGNMDHNLQAQNCGKLNWQAGWNGSNSQNPQICHSPHESCRALCKAALCGNTRNWAKCKLKSVVFLESKWLQGGNSRYQKS